MNQKVADHNQDSSLKLLLDIKLKQRLQQLEEDGLLSSQHLMSIPELLNHENMMRSSETIQTIDEIFGKPNVEANNSELEFEPGHIPTNSEALAVVLVILAHIRGTGTVASLKHVSSLRKDLEILEYEINLVVKYKLLSRVTSGLHNFVSAVTLFFSFFFPLRHNHRLS